MASPWPESSPRLLICGVDRAEGDRYPLKDINTAIKNDPALLNPSTEFKVKLLEELENYRLVQMKGARINNKAATLDVGLTFDSITEEVRLVSFSSTANN